MGGQKRKSLRQQERTRPSGKGAKKADKQDSKPQKATIPVEISGARALKIVRTSKVITTQELARQTGVRISAANAFLKKSLADGSVELVSGRSGHRIYRPAP